MGKPGVTKTSQFRSAFSEVTFMFCPSSLRSRLLAHRIAKNANRFDEYFRKGRERLDRIAQHWKRHTAANRQRRLLQPLSRLRTERVGACEPLAVAQEGKEAVRLLVGARIGGRPCYILQSDGRVEARISGANGGGLRVGKDDTSLTSTTPTPDRRPKPRSNSMPWSLSQRSWPASE